MTSRWHLGQQIGTCRAFESSENQVRLVLVIVAGFGVQAEADRSDLRREGGGTLAVGAGRLSLLIAQAYGAVTCRSVRRLKVITSDRWSSAVAFSLCLPLMPFGGPAAAFWSGPTLVNAEDGRGMHGFSQNGPSLRRGT